jgi:EmrB/QacA subfamily drug resistance transporter
MRSPCDEGVIRSAAAEIPCQSGAALWILAAAILGSSMAFIDSTVVNVALPALQSSLGATLAGVQWVVESYGLFLGALILVGGSLGDLFGRRLMFLIGVGIFALASAACGLASSVEQLVAARSIQGVGAACMVPGSLSIISAAFPEEARGKAIGTWSGFTAITTALGPVLGGWLIEHASWRWIFFLNIPLATAVFAISLRHVPESRSSKARRVDWLGAIVATLGLGGLVVGFVEAVNLGFRHPLVWTSLAAGALFVLGFGLIESRVSAPMAPLELFKSRDFSGANLLTLLLYSALGIFFFLFPMDLIQVRGYSATAAGAAGLPMILLMFLLSRWSGGLVGRYGARVPLIVGPLIVAAGFVLFAVSSTGGSYWKTLFPAFVVLGGGMAISVAPLTTVVMDSVGQDRSGTASGINNAVARVAGVLAVAVFGIVMVGAFERDLNRSLPTLPVPPETARYVQANENKLAGIELPASLDASTASAIKGALAQAFVSGLRVVMAICAGLSVASAAIAWRWIGNDNP